MHNKPLHKTTNKRQASKYE